MQTIARGGRNMELSPVDSDGSVMMTLYHFHVMLPPPHTPSEE
jgi:hypothetical protein